MTTSGIPARLRRVVEAFRRDDEHPVTAATETDLTVMLGTLGAALLSASQATNEVDSTLRSLAEAYDRPDVQAITLPTMVLVEDPSGEYPNTSIYPAVSGSLRLDQAGAIEYLIHRAAREQLDPQAVVDEVGRITTSKPRFGFVLSLIGHTLLTLGFGLVMNPTATALPVYLVLGVVMGIIVMLGSKVRTLALVLPVLAAFVATSLVAIATHTFVDGNVLLLVAPAIVSLLPGLTLTIAAVELTNGQIIAGASRLVYGFASLGLLAFGVYLGIVVSGASLDAATGQGRLGAWAPWVGILLVSLGYYLYSAAPQRSLIWIIFALALAYGAQLLGHILLGAGLSGLVGALVAVPVITLVSHVRAAPPPVVMLICAYWMLVPGALGFIGLSEAASGAAGASNTLLQTIGSVFAIAIGMVLGTGISRDSSVFARAWSRKSEPADA